MKRFKHNDRIAVWQLRQAVGSGEATECHNIPRYVRNTKKYAAFQQETSDYDSNKSPLRGDTVGVQCQSRLT